MKLQLSPYCRFIESNDDCIFAFNTLKSGSLRNISKDMRMILESMKAPTSAYHVASNFGVSPADLHSFLDIAKDAWLLQEEGADQRSILACEMEKIQQSAEKGNLLGSLAINTTLNCNLRCSYCFVPQIADSSADRKQSLASLPTLPPGEAYKTTSDFLQFVNTIDPNREIGIGLIGGEPLLALSTVRAVLSAVEAHKKLGKKIVVGITTNATIVSPEIADMLQKHEVSTIVSLDGLETVHNKGRRYASGMGSFQKVIKGIQVLRNAGIEVIIQVTVGNHNWNNIDATFFKLLRSLGVKLVGLNFDDSSNWEFPKAEDILKMVVTLFEIAADHSICLSGFWYKPLSNMIRGNYSFCGTGQGGNLHLEADGSIYACNRSHRCLAYESQLKDAISSFEFKALSNRLPGRLSRCIGCFLEGHCIGGCVAIAQHRFGGDVNAIDERMCDIYRTIVPELLKHKAIRETLFNSQSSMALL